MGYLSTLSQFQMVNILGSIPNSPVTIIDIIDSTKHLINGNNKEYEYIDNLFLKRINYLDKFKTKTDFFIFLWRK